MDTPDQTLIGGKDLCDDVYDVFKQFCQINEYNKIGWGDGSWWRGGGGKLQSHGGQRSNRSAEDKAERFLHRGWVLTSTHQPERRVCAPSGTGWGWDLRLTWTLTKHTHTHTHTHTGTLETDRVREKGIKMESEET